jgi:chromosome segregation ATPase
MTPETQLATTKAERDAHKKDAANLSTIITRLEADCVTLRDQSHDIAEERDRLRVALKDATETLDLVTRQLATANREREDQHATINTELRQRDIDARVMVDEEVRKLRAQLTAMTDARDAANDRAAMMERNAADSRAKLNTLSAMFRAAISALVRG